MLISKEIQRDMWHRVPNHKSKCRNLHWHRYKAEIIMKWDIIEEKGKSEEWMVIDFSDIKNIANGYVDENRDHWYMYYVWDAIWELAENMWMKAIEVSFIPTAENIAKHLFDILNPMFDDVYKSNLRLQGIKLRETPTSYVLYSPNDNVR